MKPLIFLTLCAAITATGVANAEMVELAKSGDGLTTLRGAVGSIKTTPKMATAIFGWATIPYEGATRVAIDNFQAGLSKKECKAGAGLIQMFTLSGASLETYEWVAGDGSMADTIAEVLCDSQGVKL